MKVRDIIKLIEADGWYQATQRAVIINTSTLRKLVELPSQAIPNDDLAPGTLNSILKQAKLKEVK
jgi:predicted RNA binding protein YcfA (HicA-like mRNA interferase family)